MNVDLCQILLVEDNLADVRLTKEGLLDAKVANELHVVSDGVEALDFLYRRNGHESAPRPHIVILDLNLPRRTGHEVLVEMKKDPSLRQIPVAVLTTSAEEIDILRSYDLGANCYLVKPVDLNQFLKLVEAIDEFWLGVVRLPGHR
ncbi:MAG: response regulator [Actinomycetota bacterium]|nr:response regulator [Actinomycetota bacterium]